MPFMKPSIPGARPSPMDALATLLGADQGGTTPAGPTVHDGTGALELARLRHDQQGEYEDRAARGDQSAEHLLKFLNQDIADDPFTGDQAQKDAKSAGDAYTNAVVMNEPSNPLAQERHHQEQMVMAKAQAEHPSQSLFPAINPLTSSGGAPAIGSGAPGAQSQGTPSPTQASNPPPGGHEDYSGRFERLTADLPPELKSMVQGILEYRQGVPTGSTALKAFAPLIGRIQQIDPTWNAAEYPNRVKASGAFRSGPQSQRATALNQAIGHLSDVNDAIPGLNNMEGMAGIPYNTIGNWMHQNTNPAISAFTTPQGALSEELGKLFHGNPSEQAARQFKDTLDVNAAPSVLHQGVGSLAHLTQTAYEELKNSLVRAMNLPEGSDIPPGMMNDLLDPKMRPLLEKMISGAPIQKQQPSQGGGGNVTVRRLE